MSKMTINLDIKGYHIEFDHNETELQQLRDIVKNFLGNNQEEMIKNFKDHISQLITLLSKIKFYSKIKSDNICMSYSLFLCFLTSGQRKTFYFGRFKNLIQYSK